MSTLETTLQLILTRSQVELRVSLLLVLKLIVELGIRITIHSWVCHLDNCSKSLNISNLGFLLLEISRLEINR